MSTGPDGEPSEDQATGPPPPAGPASAIPRRARPYQGLRAGVVSRLLACVADFVVLLAGLAALYLVRAALRLLAQPTSFSWPQADTSATTVAGALLLTAYFAVGWATTGRTFGAHLLGLRVVGGRGQRLGRARALVRAGFCVLFPLGLLWAGVSRSHRSVQDVVLRTAVVYDWTERPGLSG